MLDRRIGAREEERRPTRGGPLHEVRRKSVGTVDLEDLAVPHRFVHMCAVHHDPVAYCCLHGRPPSGRGPLACSTAGPGGERPPSACSCRLCTSSSPTTEARPG